MALQTTSKVYPTVSPKECIPSALPFFGPPPTTKNTVRVASALASRSRGLDVAKPTSQYSLNAQQSLFPQNPCGYYGPTYAYDRGDTPLFQSGASTREAPQKTFWHHPSSESNHFKGNVPVKTLPAPLTRTTQKHPSSFLPICPTSQMHPQAPREATGELTRSHVRPGECVSQFPTQIYSKRTQASCFLKPDVQPLRAVVSSLSNAIPASYMSAGGVPAAPLEGLSRSRVVQGSAAQSDTFRHSAAPTGVAHKRSLIEGTPKDVARVFFSDAANRAVTSEVQAAPMDLPIYSRRHTSGGKDASKRISATSNAERSTRRNYRDFTAPYSRAQRDLRITNFWPYDKRSPMPKPDYAASSGHISCERQTGPQGQAGSVQVFQPTRQAAAHSLETALNAGQTLPNGIESQEQKQGISCKIKDGAGEQKQSIAHEAKNGDDVWSRESTSSMASDSTNVARAGAPGTSSDDLKYFSAGTYTEADFQWYFQETSSDVDRKYPASDTISEEDLKCLPAETTSDDDLTYFPFENTDVELNDSTPRGTLDEAVKHSSKGAKPAELDKDTLAMILRNDEDTEESSATKVAPPALECPKSSRNDMCQQVGDSIDQEDPLLASSSGSSLVPSTLSFHIPQGIPPTDSMGTSKQPQRPTTAHDAGASFGEESQPKLSVHSKGQLPGGKPSGYTQDSPLQSSPFIDSTVPGSQPSAQQVLPQLPDPNKHEQGDNVQLQTAGDNTGLLAPDSGYLAQPPFLEILEKSAEPAVSQTCAEPVLLGGTDGVNESQPCSTAALQEEYAALANSIVGCQRGTPQNDEDGLHSGERERLILHETQIGASPDCFQQKSTPPKRKDHQYAHGIQRPPFTRTVYKLQSSATSGADGRTREQNRNRGVLGRLASAGITAVAATAAGTILASASPVIAGMAVAGVAALVTGLAAASATADTPQRYRRRYVRHAAAAPYGTSPRYLGQQRAYRYRSHDKEWTLWLHDTTQPLYGNTFQQDRRLASYLQGNRSYGFTAGSTTSRATHSGYFNDTVMNQLPPPKLIAKKSYGTDSAGGALLLMGRPMEEVLKLRQRMACAGELQAPDEREPFILQSPDSALYLTRSASPPLHSISLHQCSESQ